MNKRIAFLTVFALVAMPFSGLYVSNVEAAGKLVTATPNEIATATATDITFTYTATNAVEAIGTTYTFIASPTLDAALANCTSADEFADSNGTDGAGAFSGFTTTGATFTTTTATATTGRSFCVKFPSTAAAGSYSISIVSSTGDFGAALVHVGDNNDVTVTATVSPTLSFNIRNTADTADTNVCDLGNVQTTTVVDTQADDDGVGECGYSLAIGTNSDSGFTTTIDGAGLSNGAYTMTAVDENGTFGTGTEEYGLANVTAGTGVTEAGTFATDASQVPTSATTFLTSADPVTYVAGTDASDVTQVYHGLTVGASTPTGNYTETVTFQTTASF